MHFWWPSCNTTKIRAILKSSSKVLPHRTASNQYLSNFPFYIIGKSPSILYDPLICFATVLFLSTVQLKSLNWRFHYNNSFLSVTYQATILASHIFIEQRYLSNHMRCKQFVCGLLIECLNRLNIALCFYKSTASQ